MEHQGTKTIETERLLLRKYVIEDAQDMFLNWASDPVVTEHMTWLPHKDISVTKGILEGWIKGYESALKYQWAIVIKENNELIGSLGIHNISDRDKCGEIGYCIGKDYWNKGYMTETLNAVIRFCFDEVGFNRVEAMHSVKNQASGIVMKKCGMKLEGTARKRLANHEGEFIDCDWYGILKED